VRHPLLDLPLLSSVSLLTTQTYRSRSQSITIFGTVIVGGAVVIGMMLESRHVEVFIANVVFLAVLVAIGVRAARAGVVMSETGIRVMNVFSTVDLSWREIERFDVGRSGLFPLVCLIHLSDGSVLRTFGVQERTNFPNGSAEQMAEELNAELSQRRGGASDDKAIAGPRLGSGESLAS
jgi:hypothetical protein